MKSLKSNQMNWKKWIKYTLIFLIVVTVAGILGMTLEGKRMYGGLTERVDHTQFKPKEGSFAIRNVNLLSPDGDSIISGQTILLEKGLIVAIDSTLNITSETTIIDGTGKYLIPGLIDAHVHLFQSPNDLLLYIANGVTEIRELIGEEPHLEWKKEIENGRIGPKMFVASPRLGSFEPMEGWFMSWSQGYLNIENAEDARETVKNLKDKGYDGLKIYSQLTKESYVALTEAARSLEMPVMGHIPWSLELSDIWQHGQSDIAHFEEIMNALGREFGSSRNIGGFYGKENEFLQFIEERIDVLANNLLKSDITVTSSLWLNETFAKQPFELEQVLKDVELAYENPGISEWVSYIPQGLGWLPEVNRYRLPENQSPEELERSKKYWDTYAKACQLIAHNLAKRGVKIMAGTDANLPPTVPGFSLHDELESLNRAGMSAAQVLQAATAVPAAWLQSNSGKIVPGYEANVLLLDKNPLEDIRNTKSINSVIVKGKLFDRALLNSLLAAVKEANDTSRKVAIDRYK